MLIGRFHTFLLSGEATSALLMRTATKTCWLHVLTSHVAATCILCERKVSVQRKSITFFATKTRACQLRYFRLSTCLHRTSRKTAQGFLFFQWFVDFHKNLLADLIWLKSRQREQSPPPQIVLTDDGAHPASYSGVTGFVSQA